MASEQQTTDEITIRIPFEVHDKLKQRAQETGFPSVSHYISYILRQVVSKLDTPEKERPINAGDEEKVKEQLRSLGYLQ